jgi:hypothetical protein
MMMMMILRVLDTRRGQRQRVRQTDHQEDAQLPEKKSRYRTCALFQAQLGTIRLAGSLLGLEL